MAINQRSSNGELLTPRELMYSFGIQIVEFKKHFSTQI
jgi:hypothetical protein